MTTTITKQAIAELSADNAVLTSELSRMARGSEVTYATHFTKWLGRPIKNRADLKSFATVVKKLRKDYGLLLSPISGVGYRVLTNEQAAMDNTRLAKAARQAKLLKKEKATVDLSTLNQQQVQAVVGMLTIANVVEASAKQKTIERIAAAVSGATQPLALGHALERLKENL